MWSPWPIVTLTLSHHFPLSAPALPNTGLLVRCQATQLTHWYRAGPLVARGCWGVRMGFLWTARPLARGCDLGEDIPRGGEHGAQPGPVTTHPPHPRSISGHLGALSLPTVAFWGSARSGYVTVRIGGLGPDNLAGDLANQSSRRAPLSPFPSLGRPPGLSLPGY